MKELSADPTVKAHRPGHIMNVSPHFFTEIRNLIDEGDLGRQKGIRGILDHLGGLEVGDHKGRLTVASPPGGCL